MSRYHTVVAGGSLILAGHGAVRADLGIRDGRIAAIADEIGREEGEELVDARGLLVLPGAVDAHFHLGIYRDLELDAGSETESSLVGGCTSVLSYFRTGSHYLNRTGPYGEILPEVLQATAGRAHTDYGYHLAPMTSAQVGEVADLVGRHGVTSFKYYFFYKGLNLAADSADAQAYTMSDGYDFGHLFALMEAVAQADQTFAEAGRVSLSLHCENAELIKFFMQRVHGDGVPPLEEYSNARPPLTERLSVHEAGVLADATGVRVNLLHLSSAEALRGALEVRGLYPALDVRLETTLHHLCLTYSDLDGRGLGGKVNPPIRARGDVEALWTAIASGAINWVASDHACCMESMKGDDLWPALPGFGGTALIYPVLLTEGHLRRGLSLERVAQLVSEAPARAYGLSPRKGAIAVGADADLAIVDLNRQQIVKPELLHSAQDHTPFEGVALSGWPVRTILRGQTVYLDGKVVAPPSGEYLHRPLEVGAAPRAVTAPT